MNNKKLVNAPVKKTAALLPPDPPKAESLERLLSKDALMIKLINKNFLIRYRFFENPSCSFLVGAGNLHKIIGKIEANKAFCGAIDCKEDVYTKKFRNHLKIEFITK